VLPLLKGSIDPETFRVSEPEERRATMTDKSALLPDLCVGGLLRH